MALLWYSLTDRGVVELSKAAHELGMSVKKLKDDMEQLDRAMEKKSAEGVTPDIPVEEDVAKIMKEAPHWRGKPG